jgi:glucose-6-phosphate dehydrogenase assembly protein OpcA
MPTEEAVAAFINGESRAVAVEAIAEDLAALWQSVADKKPDRERVCNFNLFVYSPNEGVYACGAGALAELTRRHPCRVIALVAEPEADENKISSYLSAHFHQDNEKALGCEQITIIAKGNATDKIASIATSLLAENLPTILWWQGDLPEENVLFEKLLAASQQMIFDSADGRDVGSTLSQARAQSLHWKNGFVGDLNWLRLSRLRDLITEFLESQQAASLRDHAAEIDIDIAAAPEGDAHFAQPFLLLGWLANRLNWKLNEPLTPVVSDQPDAGNESVFITRWQGKEREVVGKIILRQTDWGTDETVTPSVIVSAQIRLQQNDDALVFSLLCDPKQAQVTLRIAKSEQTLSESTANFSETAIADLLAQEIARKNRDQIYESALRFATQLI